MKQQFTITVDIDTDLEGPSSATPWSDNPVIKVRKDAMIGAHPLVSLSHELGHVIAAKLRLQAHLSYGAVVFAGGLEADILRFEAEKEAWDVGELLVKFPIIKQKALLTYHPTNLMFKRLEEECGRIANKLAGSLTPAATSPEQVGPDVEPEKITPICNV